MKKECQVIMLPTNDITAIIVPTQGVGKGIVHLKEYYGNADIKMGDKYQHLYIVSDDEIKEGDWYINNKVTFRADDKFDEGNNPNQNKKNKKIIATTDILSTNIMIDCLSAKPKELIIPQIPQSFIIEYCKNPVDKIMVKYEEVITKSEVFINNDVPYSTQKVKINSDNTINISPIKTSWNKQELLDLAFNDMKIVTWLNENLK